MEPDQPIAPTSELSMDTGSLVQVLLWVGAVTILLPLAIALLTLSGVLIPVFLILKRGHLIATGI